MAFDRDVKEWNFLVLFKFNSKLNVHMPAVEIMKKFNSCVFVAK